MDAHPIHKGIVAGAIIDALNGDFAAFMDIGLVEAALAVSRPSLSRSDGVSCCNCCRCALLMPVAQPASNNTLKPSAIYEPALVGIIMIVS